jgi:GTP-binding protein HflX
VLPFDRFGLVGQIRPLGRVINEEYTDTGLELTVVLANADRDRLVSKYGKEILKT